MKDLNYEWFFRCYSSVGRTGGQQLISIGFGCDQVNSVSYKLSERIIGSILSFNKFLIVFINAIHISGYLHSPVGKTSFRIWASSTLFYFSWGISHKETAVESMMLDFSPSTIPCHDSKLFIFINFYLFHGILIMKQLGNLI